MSYQAFLAAIRDEPDSDVPRLICADWLEDNGEGDRAEFIRVQLELTRGVKERPRSLELLRRLRALIVEHRERWLGVLTQYAPDSVFERGFVEQVSLRVASLLRDGPAVFDRHPLHRLSLHAVGNYAVSLAACAQLACVTALDLREQAISERGLEALGGSPHLGRLRSLDLSGGTCAGAGLRRLLGGGSLRPLRRLRLRGNPVGAGGAAALAATANLPELADLDLASARLNDSAALALAESVALGELKILRISYNYTVTEAGVRALLASPRLAGLTLVEAYGTEMDTEARARLRQEFRDRVVC
jgi:uncharacterized protein (TIGR02996 family)